MSDTTEKTSDTSTLDAGSTCEFPAIRTARPSRARRSLIAAAALSLGLLVGSTALAAPAQTPESTPDSVSASSPSTSWWQGSSGAAPSTGGATTNSGATTGTDASADPLAGLASQLPSLGSAELQLLDALGVATGPSVTVTGTGTISVEPDVAKLSFAVVADGEDATAAAESANALAEAVNAALAEAGVPEEDIQTGGVSVSPRYSYDDSGNATVSGYTASVQYDLSGIAVEKVSGTLSAVLDAGVTQVYTIAYYSSTYDEQYQKALALAFEQAKGKAEALAPVLSSGENTTLALTSLTESPSSMQYRYADAGGFTAMDAVASASDVEQAKVNATVVPGTIDIEATVIAEYSLLDPSVINEAIASLAGASYEASELFS